MELEELNKLEEKVKNLVDNSKRLKEENENLKMQLQQIKKDSSVKNEERLEIKKKVTTLIALIDSIEK
ncbi:cell division protein ZapB [Acidobacteriota bacterium]